MERELNERPSIELRLQLGSAGMILNRHYLPPPADHDGKQWVRTSTLIQKPAISLYEMWRDVKSIPLWQERIQRIDRTGPRTSHWVMIKEDGSENHVEWDLEILREEPGRRIAWTSIGGDVNYAGEVIFEPAPGERGTIVTVLQEFRMTKLASAWETLTGRNPKQAIIENLRHFKSLAETGEIPRTEGQPQGPRGISAKMKKSLYGEAIPVPPLDQRIAS